MAQGKRYLYENSSRKKETNVKFFCRIRVRNSQIENGHFDTIFPIDLPNQPDAQFINAYAVRYMYLKEKHIPDIEKSETITEEEYRKELSENIKR